MRRGVALVVLLGLPGCSRLAPPPPTDEVHVSGRIEGDEVDLAFKAQGRIAEILVREGDRVEKGQLLARLASEQDTIRVREAEARLAGARARLDQANAQVATLEQRLAAARIVEEQAGADAEPRVRQARAQVDALRAELGRAQADEAQTRADADRYAKLAEKGAVAQQLAEQFASRAKASGAAVEAVRRQIAAAESAVGVAEAASRNPRVRAAEAQTIERQIGEARAASRTASTDIAAAQAGLDRSRADVNELELRAPSDGTILTRVAEPGRVVGPGQMILTLADTANLYVRGFVPEGQIARVKLAQKAEVLLDGASRPLEAEVSRVDPRAMFTPENTYFKEDRVRQVVGVKLRIKSNDGSAKIGMPADARIRVGS
jgi:HlyD family secretion protein